MKAAKTRCTCLTLAVLTHLKRVERDFHAGAFGEEMARVNFLPLTERRRHVAESELRPDPLQQESIGAPASRFVGRTRPWPSRYASTSAPLTSASM